MTLPPDDRDHANQDAGLPPRVGLVAANAEAASPAAGAHAADHLTNEEATPGSGILTSRSNVSGREVDGGAG